MGLLIACWKQIINNGVRDNLDFDQVMRIRISNGISIVGSFFALIYCIYLAISSQYSLALNDVLFISNLMMLYLLNHLGYNKAGTVLTIITVPIMLLYVNYEYGRISTDYFFYSGIVLGLYFFKKRINQLLISLFFVALIFLSKHLETVITPNNFAVTVSPYIYISNAVMSLIILFLSLSLFINEHSKYKIDIDIKNKQLNDALEETRQKNEQINLVLKELNHRVKNNLQMVSSLFNIQAYKTKNRETKKALKDARNRIVSIAIMHQKLYKDNLFHEVMLKKYIEELVEYLVQSVDLDEEVDLTVQVDDINLRIEDTVHVGLIINELVTNAIKYGVDRNVNENRISVEINSTTNWLYITVSDGGKGFSPDFEISKANTFGLDLVNNIVSQHEGKIQIHNEKGAQIKVILKIPEFSY